VFKTIIAALLILSSSVAMADEGFIGYGLGVFHDADEHLGQNKYLELGLREDIWQGIYWQYKGGFWGEGSTDPTRKAGFWVSTGPGFEVDLNPVEFRSGWGLAAISNPDSQLGSYFPQFNGEIYLGLRDKKGDGVGFQYEHISCATFCNPNQGRDFVILQLSQKW
jgi:Lipid A 3-O-deacylase (PagL)